MPKLCPHCSLPVNPPKHPEPAKVADLLLKFLVNTTGWIPREDIGWQIGASIGQIATAASKLRSDGAAIIGHPRLGLSLDVSNWDVYFTHRYGTAAALHASTARLEEGPHVD